MEIPSSSTFKSSLGLANITNSLNGIKLAKSTSLKQSSGVGGLAAACSFNDLKKFARTPSKSTALQVAAKSAKKKTPHGTIINDRYIPNRLGSNMEASYHLLHNKDKENSSQQQMDPESSSASQSDPSDTENHVDNIKRRIIIDACHGLSDNSKVLNLHSKLGEMSLSTSNLSTSVADQSTTHLTGDIKSFLPANNAAGGIKRPRHIPVMPERILDAPDFKNDYYLNLLDWSPTNNIAVALDKGMYVWSAETGEIAEVFSMADQPGGGEEQSYISACLWCHSPAASLSHILAVGTSRHSVELWDINKMVKIRSMHSHQKRVGSLAWNAHLVTSGSRSGDIHHHDIRVASHHVGTLRAHTEEICGLKWSPDGRYLASGGNDNLVAIWDSNISHDSQPLHRLTDHTAAVKALDWCPFKVHMLASGGGTACQTIKLWNASTGTLLSSTEARSQISSILWSKRYKELVSGHGLEQNQLTIWKYNSADSNHSHHMKRVCDLKGHMDRVLCMSMSPDGETVASISADETLRFWKCFANDSKHGSGAGSGHSSDSSRLDTVGYAIRKSSSYNSLTRCIR